MGVITRNAANNITTGGVILPAGINNTSVASISELEQVATGGGLNLISSQTASASSSIEFTSGIDSTYDIYKFEFINMHPATNQVFFEFQVNASGQTGFNETITTTAFRAFHFENDSAAGLGYRTSWDQAQGTGYQILNDAGGNGNDNSISGELYLFNPSSTTYVKHFMSRTCEYYYVAAPIDSFIAGYFNTTSAIDEIAFKMSSGNIDAGTIRMYGIQSS